MGAVTIKAVFYILMLVISGGLFLYTIVAGGLTWIKASNSGILQFHKLFHRGYYWCCYGIMTFSLIVSMMNFRQAYNLRKITEIIPEYVQQTARHQQNGFFYLFMAMLWLSMAILNTGFITAKGYYLMGAQKPKKIVIESRDGELQFYVMAMKKSSANKPILKLKDTPENRKQFAVLFRRRKATKGKEYVTGKISIISAERTEAVTIHRRRNRADSQG